MANIHITASYCKTLAQRPTPAVRERYVQYYKDLHNLYEKQLSPETFYEGPGYSFTELGTSVLDECEKDGELADIDLMVVVYWAHEFDPDHSSCGPYFAEKYQIKGQIFDVCDQGTISLCTGLMIIKQYLQSETYKKAILLALEQTSIPRNKLDHCIIPSKSTASVFVLQKNIERKAIELLDAEIISEHEIFNKKFNPISKIDEKIANYSEQKGKNNFTTLLVNKRSDFFFKNYQYNNHQQNSKYFICYEKLTNENGYYPVTSYITQLLHSDADPHEKIVIITDEDTSTLNTSCITLKI